MRARQRLLVGLDASCQVAAARAAQSGTPNPSHGDLLVRASSALKAAVQDLQALKSLPEAFLEKYKAEFMEVDTSGWLNMAQMGQEVVRNAISSDFESVFEKWVENLISHRLRSTYGEDDFFLPTVAQKELAPLRQIAACVPEGCSTICHMATSLNRNDDAYLIDLARRMHRLRHMGASVAIGYLSAPTLDLKTPPEDIEKMVRPDTRVLTQLSLFRKEFHDFNEFMKETQETFSKLEALEQGGVGGRVGQGAAGAEDLVAGI